MDIPVVELERLNISFGEKQVLHDFSLNIYSGQSLAVVGESGSGKSIGALLSMGLLDPHAIVTFQTANLLGRPISSMTSKQWSQIRGKEVSMVFQDPMTSLHPSIRIGKQLDEVLEHHTELVRQERKNKILRALEEVELLDPETTYSKYPHELSGGQRQRVVIAMALLLDPKLIIADEPVSALDVSIQSQILNLLLDLRDQLNLTMIFISHDLSVVRYISDKIAVMFAGKIKEYGEAETVFHHPTHSYTKKLLSAIPHLKITAS